jgi:hypothetical protein
LNNAIVGGGVFYQGTNENGLNIKLSNGNFISTLPIAAYDNDISDKGVLSVLPINNGFIAAGNYKSYVQGNTYNNICALDSNMSLLPWNPNINGPVYSAMQVDSQTLAVAGLFNSCNGKVVGNICLLTNPLGNQITTSYNTIQDKSLLDFAMYPNPAQSLLIIEPNFDESLASVCLYDMEGRCLLNRQLANGIQNRVQLELSSLSNGIYLVQVRTTDGRSLDKKCVISR